MCCKSNKQALHERYKTSCEVQKQTLDFLKQHKVLCDNVKYKYIVQKNEQGRTLANQTHTQYALLCIKI